MRTIAIIPARGGSKGIHKKNIALLMGKPLISYMLDAAKGSKYINEIVVSTDDEEIAKVSIEYGAKIKMRSNEISGDLVSSECALLDVLKVYNCDILVFLQCTAPFTTTEDIDGTIKELLHQDADTSLAVTPFHYFLWNKDGEGINHQKSIRKMRQEREPQYLEAGSVYVMRTEGFLEHKHRFFGKTVMHIIPNNHVFEIDGHYDLELAEHILQKKR